MGKIEEMSRAEWTQMDWLARTKILESLSWERRMCFLVRQNIYAILAHYSINQKELIKMLHGIVTEVQLSKILHGQRAPMEFLHEIKEVFGYSIDDFLFKDLTAIGALPPIPDPFPAVGYMEIQGLYVMFYINEEHHLKYGLIVIKKECISDMQFSVVAVLNLSRERAKQLFDGINTRSTVSFCYDYVESLSSNRLFRGNLYLNNKNMIFDLSYRNHRRDCVSMMFYRPDSNNQRYIGGLGNLCVAQAKNGSVINTKVGLSNKFLDVTDEDLIARLAGGRSIVMNDDNKRIVDKYKKTVKALLRTPEMESDEKLLLLDASLITMLNEANCGFPAPDIIDQQNDEQFYLWMKSINVA